MSRGTVLFVLAGAVGLICLALVGCSDDTTATLAPDSDNGTGSVTYYFPASDGYTTTYSVSSSTGSSGSVTFEVGDEVPFGTLQARQWSITDESGDRDMAYFVVADSAVYFYESTRASAERILALPLNPGASWDRFAAPDGVDSTSTETYWEGFWQDKLGGGSGDTNPTGDEDRTQLYLNKSFPTAGSSEIVVEAIETISVGGQSFSGAVRLKKAGSVGKVNYYWFAPGIGLVKYIIGADEGDFTEGETVGQLIHYGYN